MIGWLVGSVDGWLVTGDWLVRFALGVMFADGAGGLVGRLVGW